MLRRTLIVAIAILAVTSGTAAAAKLIAEDASEAGRTVPGAPPALAPSGARGGTADDHHRSVARVRPLTAA